MRVAAAESMPLLLECARVRGPEYLTQMWHFMCDALIKAIGTEPDSDVLSEIMHSFAKVVYIYKHRTFCNIASQRSDLEVNGGSCLTNCSCKSWIGPEAVGYVGSALFLVASERRSILDLP